MFYWIQIRSFTHTDIHTWLFRCVFIIITLFSSIISKKSVWHSGQWSQRRHADWFRWWQVQTKTSVELVCSNSQVSIRIGKPDLFICEQNGKNILWWTSFFSLSCRNRTGGKRTSFSRKQRIFMLLLVGVLGFFTLIVIMAKLGRASAGSDPNLDPLLNPNIRVGKNWWPASIASSIFVFVTR